MPGLIRGVARTAVIAGTATHVSNNVSRRQANKWAKQGQAQQAQQAPPPQYVQPQYVQQAPPPAPVEPEEDVMARIEKLAKLHSAGLITDAEFTEQKARILEEL